MAILYVLYIQPVRMHQYRCNDVLHMDFIYDIVFVDRFDQSINHKFIQHVVKYLYFYNAS